MGRFRTVIPAALISPDPARFLFSAVLWKGDIPENRDMAACSHSPSPVLSKGLQYPFVFMVITEADSFTISINGGRAVFQEHGEITAHD